MAIISILRADSYERAVMDDVVARHFEGLGIERDIAPGMTALIKPNLLTGRRPEMAVTTHPALIRAVADWLRARGIERIVLADSPGGPYNAKALGLVYRACGLEPLEPLLTLNRDTASKQVPAAPGSAMTAFQLIQPVLDADYIINIAKMKTHGMTMVSLGVKNLFGCVPGLLKPRQHFENPSADGFAKMLVSLAETIKPQLTLIDAVDAMEGNGPSGGSVKHAGLVLASRDLFAQDCVAAELMGIDPMSVHMIRIAEERGLFDPNQIERIGDDVAPARPPFALPDTARRVDFTGSLPGPLRRIVASFLDRRIKPFPVVVGAKCIGCAKCAESCPQHIIGIADKKAVIDRRRCISCFCCQEMCPAKAIDVEHKFRWR